MVGSRLENIFQGIHQPMGYCKGVQITIIFGIHTAAETLKISFKTCI